MPTYEEPQVLPGVPFCTKQSGARGIYRAPCFYSAAEKGSTDGHSSKLFRKQSASFKISAL